MTARIAIGNISGDYKMHVSKSGYDALTDDAYLLFTSEKSSFRVLQKGTVTIPGNTLSGTASISGISSGQYFGTIVSQGGAFFFMAAVIERVTADSTSITVVARSTTPSARTFQYVVVVW